MPPLRTILFAGALVVFMGLHRGAAGAAASTAVLAAASDSLGDLAPATAPPWNPERPVAGETGWEKAVRLPLRIATFPLSLVGDGTESTLRWVEEANVVPRVQLLVATLPRLGILILPASLGDRTGFGLATRVYPPRLDRALLLEASASTLKYTQTRAEVRRGPAALGYSYSWRPRERFFGHGLETSDETPASFAWREQRVELGLAWPWARAGTPAPRAQVTAWAGPRETILHHGREAPSFEEVDPALGPMLSRRQEHFVYGGAVAVDRRGGRPHWTHGWRAAISAERFDRAIPSLTIRDAHTPGAAQFVRTVLEAEAGFSFYRDPRTVRLAVQAIDQRGSDGSGPLALHDLAILGGNRGLAGFEPGRFHGEDAAVAKLSYILPLFRNLEMELHAETGGVYSRLEDLRLDTLERSYGVGIRPRTDFAPLGYLGVDWSRETVRIRFSFGGVE